MRVELWPKERKKERKEPSQAAFRHVPPIMLSQVLVFCRAPFYLSLPTHASVPLHAAVPDSATKKKHSTTSGRFNSTSSTSRPYLPFPQLTIQVQFHCEICVFAVCLSVCLLSVQSSLTVRSVCLLFVCLSVCHQYSFHSEVSVFAVCLSSVQFSL